MPRRLTESPDSIRLPSGVEDYSHPSAWAFLILPPGVVASSRRTHPYIFNALKAVSDPENASPMVQGTLRREGASGIYEDYGVHFFPSVPGPESLSWFKENYTGEMGEMRRRTKSGRIWKSVEVEKGTKVAAISFWATAAEVTKEDIGLLIQAFKINVGAPIYVEYIDSKEPSLFGAQAEPEKKELKSKKHPHYDAKKIIDTLVKAHTSPQSLTPEEKDIVDEFRGVPEVSPKLAGGFASPAERKFRSTIGDSFKPGDLDKVLKEGLGNYAPPNNPTQLFFDFYCLYTCSYRYGDLYAQYHPRYTSSQPIVHFRIAEAVSEAFVRVKHRVKALMLKEIGLACLEEALRLNNTENFDLEALYLRLKSLGIKPKGDARIKQAVYQYVNEQTPGLGGRVNGFIAETLLLALRHAHIEGGSVIYMSEFVPDKEVGALVKQMGGRIDLGLLETIFTLKWLPDHGGQKWFEICHTLKELQETKVLKNEVFLIDRLYDLEHNTGSLLEKAPDLWVTKESLTTRFMIRNVREFLPHVSSSCRKVALAVVRTSLEQGS